MRTDDGLVHNVWDPETKDRYGHTMCGIAYSAKKTLRVAIERADVSKLRYAKYVRLPVNCLQCIGRVL